MYCILAGIEERQQELKKVFKGICCHLVEEYLTILPVSFAWINIANYLQCVHIVFGNH